VDVYIGITIDFSQPRILLHCTHVFGYISITDIYPLMSLGTG